VRHVRRGPKIMFYFTRLRIICWEARSRVGIAPPLPACEIVTAEADLSGFLMLHVKPPGAPAGFYSAAGKPINRLEIPWL
jgi:hypothetical protein